MRSDGLLMALVICGFLYMAGYRSIAILIAAGVSLMFLASGLRPKAASKGKSGTLEPIIIESTRGAPYKIPEEMKIQFDPEWGGGTPWWGRVGKAGMLPKQVGKAAMKVREWID